MTDYYDVTLKKDRQKILSQNCNFYSYKGFLKNEKLLNKIFSNHNPNVIVHLAAQAGVKIFFGEESFIIC